MATAARAHLDATLSALADPTRRRVVDLLRERPRRAGELAAAFDMSAPAMSRHLRVLRTRGLVAEKRMPADGRGRVYELRPERFGELSGWLREVEQFWSEQLGAFKQHVESVQAESRTGATAKPGKAAKAGSPGRKGSSSR
jgi:DNA-binding transcriptional ArsR family regulator